MILVGTSGWQYADWRPDFYPAGLPQRRWLEHYATRFATVEVNNTFYRLPQRSTFTSWRDRSPPDFRIAVKMSRYLTHLKQLREPAEPVARFLDRAGGLGDRLGPVLLQLPPQLAADPHALDRVLTRFPPQVQVAVEPRHASWWTEPVRATLRQHRAALCWADRAGDPVTPLWRTSGFGYVRFHEGPTETGPGLRHPRYPPAVLRSWVDRIAGEFDPDALVYVYFNNDPHGAALVDAAGFADLCRRRGLPVSRTPQPVPTGAGAAG